MKTIEKIKELVFLLMTWIIGWYLFFQVITKIHTVTSCAHICQQYWIIFFTSLFLLILPFVNKIEFGKIFKIEKEVKETKEELKGLKSDIREQFNMVSNSINVLSQNVSIKNIVNVYNQQGIALVNQQTDDTIRVKNKILKTLWKYQVQFFKDSNHIKRWTFTLGIADSEYNQFMQAILILKDEGLVTQEQKTLQFYLTDQGIEYCKNNESNFGEFFYTF